MFIKCILFSLFIGLLGATGLSCPSPYIENGSSKIRQRSRGLVRFTCSPRYKLVGSRYATCRNGHWDTQFPICTRSGCTIPSIENGIKVTGADETVVMYFCLPGYKLIGSSIIYCDGKAWNASAPTCINSNETRRLSCDFEDPDLCGWTHDELHDFDWKRLNKKTPSSFLFTGPSFDHTYGENGLGFYMYIESTSRLMNDTARLISPVYDKDLTKNGCFSFFYHMYGKTCGGLKVYQKPDKLTLQALLNLPESEKKKYTLFEKWGNLGDFWYSYVSTLSDFSDDFQIIIEGIRGSSFTSDIAIDDVAIMQGENCTVARNAVINPTTVMPDSCFGRCVSSNEFQRRSYDLSCGCSTSCIIEDDCCPDFFDVCLFLSDSSSSSDDLVPTKPNNIVPQTQKLIGTTSETSTTTTTKPTTTTQRPTTTTKTTTPSPTTTTTKPTPRTVKSTIKTTPRSYTTSKATVKTITANATTVTTSSTAGSTKYIKTTIKTTDIKTTMKQSTKPELKTTTSVPHGISRTIENHDVYDELVQKSKKEKIIENRHINQSRKKDVQPTGSEWSLVLFCLGLVVCLVGVAWVVTLARSERGRIMIVRLRGRVNNDPEVRYLSTDVDDD